MNKKYVFLITILLLILIILFFTRNNENIGNPRAKAILANNPNADIIKLDGLIYMNFKPDSKGEQVFSKGEPIGEIRKKTNKTWWFGNLYSTKLPKGTRVYATNNSNGYNKGDAPFVIVVELNKEIIVYHALVEG